MKIVKIVLLGLLAGLYFTGAHAQIGYQLSLLNTATGEPRANESVVVSVTLSNSAGEAFYSETKSATANDFGVLSLSIGNADTFKDVDLTKMPFYIEVTANGVMIGKSQILNVPVTEVAKRVAPGIDKSIIVGTWKTVSNSSSYKLYTFMNNNTISIVDYSPYTVNGVFDHWVVREYGTFNYFIEGTFVYIYGKYADPDSLKSDSVYYFEELKLINGNFFGNYKTLTKLQ